MHYAYVVGIHFGRFMFVVLFAQRVYLLQLFCDMRRYCAALLSVEQQLEHVTKRQQSLHHLIYRKFHWCNHFTTRYCILLYIKELKTIFRYLHKEVSGGREGGR